MNKETAQSIVKSINRHCRKSETFKGGREYGIDFSTFSTCYPQISKVFCNAAKILVGRKGRFLPQFHRSNLKPGNRYVAL